MTSLTKQQARAIVDTVLAAPRTDPGRPIACAVLIRDDEGRALGAVGVAGEAGYHDEHLAGMAIGAIGPVADAG